MGEAGDRARRSRCGTPALCIQCNKCAFVCPHAAIRAKVYAPPAHGGRPGQLQSRCRSRARNTAATRTTRCRWRPRTAPAARCACMVCPAKDKANPRHKALNMRPQRRCASASGTTGSSSSALPEVDRAPRQARRQGHAVPPAAVRVLGRLRRLRRDALPQAADAALRRPAADRQRHRLLVDLRRQPADHAVHAPNADGRGPAWANSLFEDNAEFGLGLRLAVDSTAARARDLVRRAGAVPSATTLADGLLAARPVDRGRHRGAARAGGRAAAARSRAARSRRACACPLARRLRWCRRASGSSAATGGPTTSASAASTTCWRSAARSTCWCSTPRSTRTPAGSSRRRRRSAPRPSSPPPARRPARRTWRSWR